MSPAAGRWLTVQAVVEARGDHWSWSRSGAATRAEATTVAWILPNIGWIDKSFARRNIAGTHRIHASKWIRVTRMKSGPTSSSVEKAFELIGAVSEAGIGYPARR